MCDTIQLVHELMFCSIILPDQGRVMFLEKLHKLGANERAAVRVFDKVCKTMMAKSGVEFKLVMSWTKSST